MTGDQHPAAGFEDSWYHATAASAPGHPALETREETDVCVIGAGYTGLSAAIELAERGYRVVVLEAYRVGSGASGRNGGLLGMGQRKDQQDLERWLGLDTARALWRSALDANALVRERIARYRIDCDLKDGELHAAHRARHVADCHGHVEHLARAYDYHDCEPLDAAQVAELIGTDVYHGGYRDRNAGHLHPLNLVLGLARAAVGLGVRIFENSAATGCSGLPEPGGSVGSAGSLEVRTARGRVAARYLVVACNGYLDRFLGALDRRIAPYQMPINNFLLATAPLTEARARRVNRDDLAVVDSRFVVNYFHLSPDRRLIFGGGEAYSARFPRDLKAFVRRRMLQIYPWLDDVPVDYAWGGTLAITLNRMPNFGRLGDSVYWAQGYSGHGIALANLGGKLVAEAIAGNTEGFDLYARLPRHRFPGGRLLRWPALVVGMLYYSMLDRL